jgi:outer membrane protein OmpA-like peptidoglycan-associated protein
VPIAVLVTGALAVVAFVLQGPALRAHLANATTQSEKIAVQASIDRVLAANPITFQPDSAKPTSTGVLTEIAGILNSAPAGMTFEVGGHVAPGPGGELAALNLSQARADAVVKALTDAGVPGDRITAKGYGDTRPSGHGDDRRVEIMVRG